MDEYSNAKDISNFDLNAYLEKARKGQVVESQTSQDSVPVAELKVPGDTPIVDPITGRVGLMGEIAFSIRRGR